MSLGEGQKVRSWVVAVLTKKSLKQLLEDSLVYISQMVVTDLFHQQYLHVCPYKKKTKMTFNSESPPTKRLPWNQFFKHPILPSTASWWFFTNPSKKYARQIGNLS